MCSSDLHWILRALSLFFCVGVVPVTFSDVVQVALVYFQCIQSSFGGVASVLSLRLPALMGVMALITAVEAVNTLLERAARTRCLSSSLGVILPFIHHWAVWPVGVLGVNALVSV